MRSYAIVGRGKGGGGRAIFYLMVRPGALFMLTAYAKNERADLSNEQRKLILASIESFLEDRE